MKAMKIGVLNIQGSVEEHLAALQKLKAKTVLVKNPEDLKGLSGLIIPGGESTTITLLLKKYGLDKAIIKAYKKGMALYGTCAGAIILGTEVEDKSVKTLKLIDVTVDRNAYGSQLESFETDLYIPEIGKKKLHAIFIRAPKIVRTGKKVKLLAKQGNDPILVKEGRIMLSTFHPELTDDLRIHKYFIEKICQKN